MSQTGNKYPDGLDRSGLIKSSSSLILKFSNSR